MTTTLEGLAIDIRRALVAEPGRAGKEAVCKLVSAAMRDAAFVAHHVTPEQCNPRKVLYEDKELGFCICGHYYEGSRSGGPHDHGPTWAIYGLAAGATTMTDWRIVKPGSGDSPALVEPTRHYELRPGDCHFYDVGVVHSPKFEGVTRLLRIEGRNLDTVKRSNIKAA